MENSDTGSFDKAEMLLVGFRRFLREQRTSTNNKALKVFLSEVDNDLEDAANRLTKLRSKSLRPAEDDVVPYGEGPLYG